MKSYNILTIAGILAAAAWFTLCDKFFHINNDILVYYWGPLDVIFKGQSVWTFPIFACATTGFFLIPLPFAESSPAVPNITGMTVNVLICTLAYFGSGLFGNTHPLIYCGVVLALWVIRIPFVRAHRATAIQAGLLMGLFGCFWEGATSQLGYFAYRYTDIFNVPLWLFACYLHAGFLMLDLQGLREFVKKGGTLASIFQLHRP